MVFTKKKGFTLIELLAVIVILAIILLIAMPIVLNVISEARKGAFEATARGLIKAAENEYMSNAITGNVVSRTYVFANNSQAGSEHLEFSGNAPRNGYIYVNEEGKTAVVLENGDWLVTKGLSDTDVTSEEFVDQDIDAKFDELVGILYTVTYDANNGVCTPLSREVVPGNTAAAPICERSGYYIVDFERTVGSEAGVLNAGTGEVTNVSGNQTIRVNWESEVVGFTCGDVFTDDRDSKTYATVLIGTQCWFKTDLAYTGNNCLTNNWNTVEPFDACKTQTWESQQIVKYQSGAGVCPTGWHIPSDTEWKTLEMTMGMTEVEADSSGWRGSPVGTALKANQPGFNGSDTHGFTGILTGYRGIDGELYYASVSGNWWSSTYLANNTVYKRMVDSGYTSVYRSSSDRAIGNAIRCIKN